MNNPSNPCGSVYTAQHIRDVLEVAENYKIPIIADEIYADFVRDINSARLQNYMCYFTFISRCFCLRNCRCFRVINPYRLHHRLQQYQFCRVVALLRGKHFKTLMLLPCYVVKTYRLWLRKFFNVFCVVIYFRWVVPGWRMGWILIHDRNDIFAQEVRQGLMDLSQRILGPNTVVQGAVERILKETPQDYYDSIIKTVKVSTTFQFLMKTSRLIP